MRISARRIITRKKVQLQKDNALDGQLKGLADRESSTMYSVEPLKSEDQRQRAVT